jgi:hypothetical protein
MKRRDIDKLLVTTYVLGSMVANAAAQPDVRSNTPTNRSHHGRHGAMETSAVTE